LNKRIIIFTPTHQTSLDYLQYKEDNKKYLNENNLILDINVIQAIPYHYMKEFNYDTIIIDEYSMVNQYIWKCLCYLQNRFKQDNPVDIIAFGDCHQLLPIEEDRNKEPYDFYNSCFKNIIFSKFNSLGTNYRNDFTPEYYDYIQTCDLSIAIEEVLKYSTPYETSDIILCFENNTCDIYNDKYMAHHNITPFGIGCKVICKSNNMYKKYNIPNRTILTISLITDDETTLITEDKTEFIINNKTLKRCDKNGSYINFKPAYALTINSFQGNECKSYHFPIEDISYINNRMAYTIISRLKTKFNTINN
jgi:hypothetical protein